MQSGSATHLKDLKVINPDKLNQNSLADSLSPNYLSHGFSSASKQQKTPVVAEKNKNAADATEVPTLNQLVFDGNVESVKEFLASDTEFLCNHSAVSDGFTPLMAAVCLDDMDKAYEISKLLLNAEASPLIRDDCGNSAFHWAAKIGNVKILKLLLDNVKPDALTCVNKDGNSLLHVASKEGHIKCCDLLLAYLLGLDYSDAGELVPVSNYLKRSSDDESVDEDDPEAVAAAATKKKEAEDKIATINEKAVAAIKARLKGKECEPHEVMNLRNKKKALAYDCAAADWSKSRPEDEKQNDSKSGLRSATNKKASPSEIAKRKEFLAKEVDERHNLRNQIQELFCLYCNFYKTVIYHHDDCLGHLPVEHSEKGSAKSAPKDVWEAPERLVAIMENINKMNQTRISLNNNFEVASTTQLERAHSKEYVKFVHDLAEEVKDTPPVPFTPRVQDVIHSVPKDQLKEPEHCDTSFSKGSLNAALRAAGAVTTAIDTVVGKKHKTAFCVVRPPGHHSGVNGLLEDASSCGFCLFNNVVIGALHALDTYEHIKRVAIVDFDVHHGNGTEEIVQLRNSQSPDDEPEILFFSSHLFDSNSAGYEFYPGSGLHDDTLHNVINVALAPLWRRKGIEKHDKKSWAERFYFDHWGRNQFRRIIKERLLPPLRSYKPDLIIISAGFDAARGDVGNSRPMAVKSLGGFNLQRQDFMWVTAQIGNVSNMVCDGRVVSVLEGGYGRSSNSTGYQIDRTSLARNCVAHIEGLYDSDLKWEVDSDSSESDESSEEELDSDLERRKEDEMINDRRRSRRRRVPSRFKYGDNNGDRSGHTTANNSVADSDDETNRTSLSDNESQAPVKRGRGRKPTKRARNGGRANGSRASESETSNIAAAKYTKKQKRRGRPKTVSAAQVSQRNSSSNYQVPERATTARKHELKKEDALAYLHRVKQRFWQNAKVYQTFLGIMGEFKQSKLTVMQVIEKVKSLFYGHPDLVVGFNTFLPEGYHISHSNLAPAIIPKEVASSAAPVKPKTEPVEDAASNKRKLEEVDQPVAVPQEQVEPAEAAVSPDVKLPIKRLPPGFSIMRDANVHPSYNTPIGTTLSTRISLRMYLLAHQEQRGLDLSAFWFSGELPVQFIVEDATSRLIPPIGSQPTRIVALSEDPQAKKPKTDE